MGNHTHAKFIETFYKLTQDTNLIDIPVLDSIFKIGIDLGQHVAHPAKGCKMYCFFTVSLSFRGFAKSTTIHQNSDHNLRQKTYSKQQGCSRKPTCYFANIFISDLFSVPSDKCPLYIAFSTKSLTSYGSLCNYLEVIVQPNLSLGDDKNFLSNYEVQLMTLRKS